MANNTKKAKKEKLIQAYDQGAVLYVDGGCRPGYPKHPDTKCGGWGIHGYTYNLGEYPPKMRTKKDVPTVRGYDIGEMVEHEDQVIPTGYIDAFGSMTEKDDSTKAELKGFESAIELVKEKGYKKVHFLLDNQYVIQGVTGGYEKWSAVNWRKPDGGTYSNRETWNRIMDTYYPLQNSVDFSISWVNGHSGNLGNDRADYLATKGVFFGRNGEFNHTVIKHSPIAKYRDPKPEINRLFTKSRWYFNTINPEPDKAFDGRYIYHCGSHGPDDTLIGKPISDSVAYIVLTKVPMTVLDKVREHHMRLVENPLNLLCMARLDTLLLPRIYQEILEEGTNVLSLAPRSKRIKGLITIESQEATKIIEPSGLTFKLTNVHNFMEKELERYYNGKATLTDITEVLYSKSEDKKKGVIWTLNLEPVNKVIRTDVYINEKEKHRCSLSVGIDIPPRELLNAIKEREPKVYVTTWSLSEYAFRYAVIFDCGDDTMIWMGKDSSLQFVYPEEIKQKAKKKQ